VIRADDQPNPYLSLLLGGAPAAPAPAGSAAAALGNATTLTTQGGTPFDQYVQVLRQSGFPSGVDFKLSGKLGSTDSPPVYMGGTGVHPAHIGATFDPETGGKTGVVKPKGSTDKITTVDAANNLPYLWSQEKDKEVIAQMNAMGFDVHTFDDMVKLWQAGVDRASKTYLASDGSNKMTPWDALELYGKDASASGSSGFTGSKSMVSRSVSDISEGQAWSVLQSNLSNMLGRDPSDEEVRDFTYRMGQLAAKNPSITKTIARYKNGDEVSESSHTKPGFTTADIQRASYDDAQADPDYGAFQAASTYFNAALSALGPIGG
jgi:hypothetical protein